MPKAINGPRTNYVHKSVHNFSYVYLIVPSLARLDYIRIFNKKCLKVGKCVELW